MSVIRELYLDLEDTVITPVVSGWRNCEFINESVIREFVQEFRPDHISLFSFAIHNQRELLLFEQHLRSDLEQWLGCRLDVVPRVNEDIIPACCRVMRIHPGTVDFIEASAFWGKHTSFKLWLRDRCRTTWAQSQIETEVLFLDDAVANEDFRWPDIYVRGSIRNIDHPIRDRL